MINFLVAPFVASIILLSLSLGKKRAPELSHDHVHLKHATLAQWTNLVLNFVWAALFFVMMQSQVNQSFSLEWLPLLKSNLAFQIDGLNLPLIVLNLFLSICLAFYSLKKPLLDARYLALFFMLNGASVGSLLASDALVFYLFWEFMLIPLFLLILKWGSKNRVYAALKFFAFTMAGSLFMLLAIVALSLHPQLNSLGWENLKALQLPFTGWGSTQGLLFLAFLAAFAVKIPVWPLHTWLPDAHTEAPTGASVILAGVLLKLGVYGIARWCLAIFPEAAQAASSFMMLLGVLGIVLGSFAAWNQKDIKRMIAYSSVAHLGFMVLGLFALQTESIEGALFQNLAHGLSTGALFLIFGIIYDRTHTRAVEDYGGLASTNSFLALTFMVATMASIGLPGLPGFVGEFLILSGSYMKAPLMSLLAVSGVLLGGIYMLSLAKKMIWGPELAKSSAALRAPLLWSEYVAVVPLILAMVVLGFWPGFAMQVAVPIVNLISAGLK